MKKKYLNIDNIFVFILILILLGGFINPILRPSDVNYYENRDAYKIPKIDYNEILNGNFQKNMELAFTDQIPLSTYMKKGYNYVNNKIKFEVNMSYYNKYDNIYIPVSGNIYMYGNDNNLVYKPVEYEIDIDAINNRISNINSIITNYKDIEFFVYFVDKDTEIDFTNNTTTGTYDFLKSNLKINNENIDHLKIQDFNGYKDYFYKTDHHWNYKGSYQGYKDIINMISENEEILEPIETVCLNKTFSGSKASLSGTTGIYTDDFCAYKFNLLKHKTYIDGVQKEYGNQEEYFNKTIDDAITYGSFYGADEKTIKFDFNQPSKGNLLILGESYDNAINLLLASHFNITYNVDLRNYKEEKFQFSKFIKENEIDKVLFVGNYNFFEMETFNLEG